MQRGGAAVPPGATAFTRMPCSAYPHASPAVMAFTPSFAAAYDTRLMLRVATEDMLTMQPRPPASMTGSTAWQHHRVGNSDRRTSASMWSGSYSAYGLAQIVPPTLLTRMSMRPNRSRAVAIDRWQSQLIAFQVRHHGQAACLDLVHQVGPVGQHHPRALPRQAQRHVAADALRGAGDDGHLARKASGPRCAIMGRLLRQMDPVTTPLGENFSKWKLAGVTPCAWKWPRTASTIAGAPRR